MMRRTPEDIGVKMNALGIWEILEPYNFALCPRGTVFPYFCTVLRGDGQSVVTRFLMLEGWQTLHDYVRMRIDRNFGFYMSPAEMPHLELVLLSSGEARLFRHDIGYAPAEARGNYRRLASRLLWEAYGVMLRVESDRGLPMRFSAERAIFARVENAPGRWSDRPLEIPDPPPYAESVSFPKEDVKTAQDLPFVREHSLDLDFRLLTNVVTKEKRPRCVYELIALDTKTGEPVIRHRVSVHPEAGLRGLWETMPSALLKHLIERGRVPGEIRIRSGRVFRFLRPLCLELPFKLSLHDALPALDQFR